MIPLMLLGAGVGMGCWLVVRALSPRPVGLDALVRQLGRPGQPANVTTVGREPLSDRAGRFAARVLGGSTPIGTRHEQSLRLTGRTPERHALDKLIGGAGGGAAAGLASVGLTVVGVAPPAPVLAVMTVAVAVGGFFLPDALLREEAERRRRAFRHALSAYLDLVNVILAGGGGMETSLHAAADAGDGWAFAAIRQALDRSRLTNRTPWDTFGQLGEELGVDELCELAASVALAGSQGARIRQSLAAKADSLRGHQVAETEASAEAATERMTIPVAVLLFGFLLFVAYPAVQQITSVSSHPLP
ncbi:MAG: type II secretion system F family protein [Acidimicrobiales bacterium]